MKNLYHFIVFSVFFISCLSCRSTPNPVKVVLVKNEVLRNEKGVEIVGDIDSLVAESIPIDGNFILAGLSAHFYDRDDEERTALIHAARQLVLFFDGAYIVSQQYLMQKASSTQYANKSEIRFDDELIHKYLDGFTFLKESGGVNYYSALLQYSGNETLDIPEITIEYDKNGRPSWVNTPPVIEGYTSAVGVAGRQLTFAESWKESDKAGMAEIAKSMGTNMQSQITFMENEKGSGTQAGTYTITSEKISGILVLCRWREADHNTYYSLVVKKK